MGIPDFAKMSIKEQEQYSRRYAMILEDYNPEWPSWFSEERFLLQQNIGLEKIVRITHYGSTAIPAMKAKPIIDILVEVVENIDIMMLVASLPFPDYICPRIPEPSAKQLHMMFLKGYLENGYAERVFHIHVRYSGDWDELYFRDYLIAHPEYAAIYAELKNSLIKTYEYDRNGYTSGKFEFVREITSKAREELGRTKNS